MLHESSIQEYWVKFLTETGRRLDLRYNFCGHMGPTEEIANQLASLILSGEKTATTSCLLSYETEKEPIPVIGSLGIVTDWNGNPQCIIENVNVTILAFKEMTFDICKREGEDLNLQSWQTTHFDIFTKEGEKLGYMFTMDTPIVFEDFRVIYR